MDNDTAGVAERTLSQVRTWPPGLPIFGLLTPLPATPLYKRLEAAGRLTRVKHWQEFIPFAMAHTPLKMSIEEAHAEVKYGWAHAYSPEALAQAVDSLDDQPLGYRINIFHRAAVFPRNLFPHDGEAGMGESDRGEPAYHFQAGEGSGVRAQGAAAADLRRGKSRMKRQQTGAAGERLGVTVLRVEQQGPSTIWLMAFFFGETSQLMGGCSSGRREAVTYGARWPLPRRGRSGRSRARRCRGRRCPASARPGSCWRRRSMRSRRSRCPTPYCAMADFHL